MFTFLLLALLANLVLIIFVVYVDKDVVRNNQSTRIVSSQDPKHIVSFRYNPNALELLWQANYLDWTQNPCFHIGDERTKIALQETIDAEELLFRLVAKVIYPREDGAPFQQAKKSEYIQVFEESLESFSSIVTTFSDGSTHTSYLEPLIGTLRDPRHICYDFDKSFHFGFVPSRLHDGLMFPYFVLDPREWDASRLVDGRPSAILFDLGASTYSDQGNILAKLYSALGLEFSHIYAWEVKNVTPQYWEGMPLNFLKNTHFFNFPVSADIESPRSALRLLQEVARPDDYVVFKLDIDTPEVEIPIINEIIARPDLASLIDVLFFEHHVDYPEMRRIWGSGLSQTLADSYTLFRKLRELGIRAHSYP